MELLRLVLAKQLENIVTQQIINANVQKMLMLAVIQVKHANPVYVCVELLILVSGKLLGHTVTL